MTAPLRQQRIRIDPVAVFIARAEARAVLWATGEITLHDAIDELWADAVRDGLVTRLDADHVQRILADAVAPVRDDLPRDQDDAPDLVGEKIPPDSAAFTDDDYDGDDYDGLTSTFAAACRKADEKQRRKPPDPRIEKLRCLMEGDASLERAWHELNKRAPGDVPIATLHAAEYLLQLGALERWKKWFDAHTAPERAAILQYLERRKGRRGK
jgi:hypothetical protein